jgi:hypothetical protein
MKGYSSEVGAATGAGGPLDISNVPMVAGLSNRYSGIGNALGLQYKSNVQKLQGMGQYISGQRQYMRWRYPSRYGISRSGRQTYSLPTPIMLQLPKPLLPITSTPTPSGNIDKVGS